MKMKILFILILLKFNFTSICSINILDYIFLDNYRTINYICKDTLINSNETKNKYSGKKNKADIYI